MAQTVTLSMDEKKIIRSVDPFMMSYNVEFAKVTGGTFWKEYTPEQIAGTEPFSYVLDENGQPDPMQIYPPGSGSVLCLAGSALSLRPESRPEQHRKGF